MNEIGLCLPKGDNLKVLASILEQAEFPMSGYTSDNRTYRPVVSVINRARAKIFAEKDVAIQVAVGNYAVGFCSLDWVEEYRTKFIQSNLQILKKLGVSYKKLYACCHKSLAGIAMDEFKQRFPTIRIVSEYPNLSEDFAIKKGFKRYKIFPAWGSVEVYPPEHAELVILSVTDPNSLSQHDLIPFEFIMESELCLIMNQRDYESKNLSQMLSYF
jgi:ATP phosphoribosyltransferase